MLEPQGGHIRREGLSLRFHDCVNDQVYLEASTEDRRELLAFVQASLDDFKGKRVDISNHAANLDDLKPIYEQIESQLSTNSFLQLSRSQFLLLTRVASVWQDYGFSQVNPENYGTLAASKATCDTLQDLREQLYARD